MLITTESPQLQYPGIEVDDAPEISERIGPDGVDVEYPITIASAAGLD